MLAQKSEYYPELLQLFCFLKKMSKTSEILVSETIKRMSFQQFYMSITNQKFQTVIMKEILTFLLKTYINPKWERSKKGNVSHYLLDGENYIELRNQLIQDYYNQFAIKEYELVFQQENRNQCQENDHQNGNTRCEESHCAKSLCQETFAAQGNDGVGGLCQNENKIKPKEALFYKLALEKKLKILLHLYKNIFVSQNKIKTKVKKTQQLANALLSVENYENGQNGEDDCLKNFIKELQKDVCKQLEKGTDKNKKGEKKYRKEEQDMLLLGEYNKQLFIFVPNQPQYIIKIQKGKYWDVFDKKRCLAFIRKVLTEEKTVSNLLLLENMSIILEKYMVDVPKYDSIVLQKYERTQFEENRLKRLKEKLLLNQQRYDSMLYAFGKHYWGTIIQRKQYVDSIKNSQSIEQLMEVYHNFHLKILNRTFYNCSYENQNDIPLEKVNQSYFETSKVIILNLNVKAVKIIKNYPISGVQLIKRIYQDQETDRQALFEILILYNSKAIEIIDSYRRMLEKKSQKYKRKPVTHKTPKKNPQNESAQMSTDLKTRSKKKQKVFGVNMVNYDDLESEQNTLRKQNSQQSEFVFKDEHAPNEMFQIQ